VVRFTFCAGGQLRLTNSYYVVADAYVETPVDLIETRYSWTMASNGIVYELVTMNNDFFELNVYGSNGAVYYGRFVQ